MPRKKQTPRIQFTPTPSLRSLLEELAALQGCSLSKVAADLLNEAEPVIRGQLEALKAIAHRPQAMEEYLRAYANQVTHEIAQAVLDLGEGEKRRRRKNAST